MPEKHALIIGINDYPFLADFAQLRGCHNDAVLFKNLLQTKFGFESSRIRLLLSPAAKRAAILGAMAELLANCRADDTVVFFFSGHGSRIKDAARRKPSGWYETIMPSDSGRIMYHPKAVNRDITDDEIGEWLAALGRKTPNIALFFDSCFASSIVREDGAPLARKGVSPAPESPREPVFRFDPNVGGPAAPTDKGPAGWLPVSDSYVFFSAAREYEPANVFRPESGENEYGVFSYFLCEALRKAAPGDTYRNVWEYLFVRVKNHYDDQHPQLEGRRDRRLFALDEARPAPYLAILRRKADRVTLAGGELHGVRLGSIWNVYAPEKRLLRPAAAVPAGRIRILAADSLTAEAAVEAETAGAEIANGFRAVEIYRPPAARGFRVSVENTIDELAGPFAQFRRSLLESNDLRLVDQRTEADARIILQKLKRRAQNIPNIVAGSAYVPAWVVLARNGRPLMPPFPFGRQGGFRKIVETLRTVSHYEFVLDLENPAGALRGLVDFDLLRLTDAGNWAAALAENDQPLPVFAAGERIAMRIVNRSSEPIFFSIFDLGLSRSVTQIYPPRGANILLGPAGERPAAFPCEVAGTGVLTVGTATDTIFQLNFPSIFEYDETGRAGPRAVREGVEIYKLFATTRFHDLGYIERQGIAGAFDFPSRRAAPTTRGDKEFGPETLSRLDGEWITVEKPFILREKNPRPH